MKNVFLDISQNLQENTCARVSFLIKLQAAPATLLKKGLWHRCFPVNFAKFLRTPFFTEHLWWLLLLLLVKNENDFIFDCVSFGTGIIFYSSLHSSFTVPIFFVSININCCRKRHEKDINILEFLNNRSLSNLLCKRSVFRILRNKGVRTYKSNHRRCFRKKVF